MATVPVTRTWVTGEVVTAGYMNTNITDVLNWLLAPALCQTRQIVTQSPANNTWTAITFTAEDVDTTGMHSTVSNTDRLTAVYPGWYDFAGGVPWASNATGIRGARYTVGGTAVNGSAGIIPAGSAALVSLAKPLLVFLNVSDIARLEGIQTSGAGLATVATAESQATATAAWRSN